MSPYPGASATYCPQIPVLVHARLRVCERGLDRAGRIKYNEEDSPTLNLPIWPLERALDKGRRFKHHEIMEKITLFNCHFMPLH
jgi:hypothetical protein